jgi:rod shape-determining protein MreB
MVVSEPFAVAYSLGALNNALIVDIGAGTVDFCVMHGTMPGEEDQRTLTTAGDYVDRQLYDLLREKYPQARFSETFVRAVKEEHGFVGKTNGRVKVNVPVAGKFTPHDLTDELKQACESVVPAIAETVIDLVARYEPDFQERVRKNIYLAGGGSQTKGIAETVAEALKEYGTFKITPVDDPLYAGAEGALALAQDMPEEYWEAM